MVIAVFHGRHETRLLFLSPDRKVVIHLGRLAAVLAMACAVLHLVMAVSALSLAPTVIGLGMAAMCLPCIAALWRGPTPATWRMAAGMAGVMLGLHWLLGRIAHHALHAGGDAVNGASFALLTLAATMALAGRRSASAGPAWRLTRDQAELRSRNATSLR